MNLKFQTFKNSPVKFALGCLLLLAALVGVKNSYAQDGPPVPDFWLLNAYHFDDTNLVDLYGKLPMRAENVQLVESFESDAIRLGGNGAAFLQYHYFDTNYDLDPIINYKRGSAWLWYQPLVDTSESSTNVLPFLELGAYGNSNGWWSWYLYSNHVYFAGASNGQEAVYLDYGPVFFPSNQWVFLALNYSLTNSTLYINGQAVTNGGGVLYWPNASYLLTNVVSLGCNSSGDTVNGDLDLVRFYNGWASDWMIARFYTNVLNKFGGYGQFSAPEQMEGEGTLLNPGDCGPYTLYAGGQVYLTNVSVQGSNLCFSVAGGDTNKVYDLFGCTNLAGNSVTNSTWTWLARVATCQTYQLTDQPWPTMFYMLGATNDYDADGLPDAFELLASHSATNNADSDGDGLPDGWEWLNFGNFAQTASGDYDQDGLTNLEEYQQGSDPNTISFSVRLGNQHFNVTNATGTFQVFKGAPNYWAVQVGALNGGSASWNSYNGQLTIPLGPTNGAYPVWIGLKGRAPTSTPIWMGTTVYLDTVAPTVVITNPVNSTVTQPFIQIKGYATERLSWAKYSITNASGVKTNQQAFLTTVAGPSGGPLTNNFQCFDVALTSGTNRIVVTVSDLAGNLTSTTLRYVLDYSAATNPPALQVSWPPAGMAVGSSNIFITGQIDDETATITLSGPGWSVPLRALVERNGTFWLQNVALLSPTNLLTLTISNAAGNVMQTNLTIVQSPVQVNINPVAENQLNQQTVTVSGTVSDPTYTVQVNGTEATVDANGNWTAENVSMSTGGTAFFSATASNGTNSTTAAVEEDKPAEVKLVYGTWHFNQSYPDRLYNYDEYSFSGNYSQEASETNGANAHGTNEWTAVNHLWDNADRIRGILDYYRPVTGPIAAVEQTYILHYDGTEEYETNIFLYQELYELYFGADWVDDEPWAVGAVASPADAPRRDTESMDANVRVVLRTGGKAGLANQNLFVFNGWAQERTTPYISAYYLLLGPRGFSPQTIPPESLSISGYGSFGWDGKLYAVLPDNAEIDVTLQASAPYYEFAVDATKYKPYITANSINLENNAPEFCVGQYITFSLNGLPTYTNAIVQWALPDSYVNDTWRAFINGDVVGSLNYTNNPNLLTNFTTSCWFYDGIGGQVSGGISLDFANGQQAVIVKNGYISICSPSILSITSSCTGISFLNPNGDGKQELGLMNYSEIGMDWGVKVRRPDNFGGSAWYTQLIKFSDSYDTSLMTYSDSTDGDFWLDDGDPFGDVYNLPLDLSPEKNVPLRDAPSLKRSSFSSFVENQDDFHSYLRWQPSTPGSIAVSLGQIDWGWHGRAQLTNSAWSLVTSNWYGPSPDWSDHSFPMWRWTYHK